MYAASFNLPPLRRIAFLLLMPLALVACDAADPNGGGGGGLDTTPPSASSASTDGSKVTISFNEAIDPTSVRADAFSLTPGSASIASASASGSTVTVTLSTTLDDDMRRTYTLAYTGIMDAAGNRASGSVTFDYGTDPPPMTALRLDFGRIEVVRDCDGLLEGDGEFEFRVTASTSTGQSHTAYSGSRTMGDGDVFTGLADTRFEFPATAGQQVDVTFRATEFDQDIFGNVFPDDRMDGRTATGTHRFNGGAWSNTGAITLTNGSGDCEVRLYYAALPD